MKVEVEFDLKNGLDIYLGHRVTLGLMWYWKMIRVGIDARFDFSEWIYVHVNLVFLTLYFDVYLTRWKIESDNKRKD